MKKGIDVSSHQGTIDWVKVKPHIDFAIIRAGYGQDNLDSHAVRNVKECVRLGIPYGLYWFSYAWDKRTARLEASRLYKFIKDYSLRPEYPIYYDYEYDSDRYATKKMGRELKEYELTEIVTAFCDVFSNAGYYIGLYTNPDYYRNRFSPTLFAKYDIWLAHYANKPFIQSYLWQYSDKERISGIATNVDMNIASIDFPQTIKKCKLNGF